jgi:hypothetical protein
VGYPACGSMSGLADVLQGNDLDVVLQLMVNLGYMELHTK